MTNRELQIRASERIAIFASMALVFISLGVIAYSCMNYTKVVIHTPPHSLGHRIKGTNYVVFEGDTLEIHKKETFYYMKLNAEEKKKARRIIDSRLPWNK